MSPALLEVSALEKSFPGRRGFARRGRAAPVRALGGVSFSLQRGECLALVGESGSGKSTLARTIVGLERPDSGSIRFDGVELTRLGPRQWLPLRRRLQLVSQNPDGALDPRLTAGEILSEPLEIHRIGTPRERREAALALLDAVGLSARSLHLYPHEFSGGQRQRLVLARALALEPELIVCDEPLSALDVSVQAQILALLRELQQRYSLAYLFVSHDLAVVRTLCSRVAVLYAGRLVELSDAEPLFAAAHHPYTRALLEAVPVPDPELERLRRSSWVGRGPCEPPDPRRLPVGCAYEPRCPLAAEVGERCRLERPELGQLPGGRTAVACHAFTR